MNDKVKRTIVAILALLISILAVGCQSSEDSTTDPTSAPSDTTTPFDVQNETPQNEMVTLSISNYSKYLMMSATESGNYYQFRFYGWNGYRFHDVVISYSFDGRKTVKTCTLDEFGSGHTENTLRRDGYSISICSITGTVEILTKEPK